MEADTPSVFMSRKSKKTPRQKATGRLSVAAASKAAASAESTGRPEAQNERGSSVLEGAIFGAGINDRWKAFGVVVFLVVIVWAVFGQAIGFGFINYDDPENVYENPHVVAGLSGAGIEWAFTCLLYTSPSPRD